LVEIITADQAAKLIKDESTVASSGMGVAQWAEEIFKAIENRYIETGHPKNITVTHGGMQGDWNGRSITYLGKEGLVKRWIGALFGTGLDLMKLVEENKIECYCFPLGVVYQLWSEIAAKRPGLLTKVGMGTFVDPRVEGGKMNSVTKEDIIKVVEFEDEEWLFFKSYPIDFALIRGTTADENGNITMEKEAMILDGLQMATAAKNCGGKVIVQVEQLTKAGTMHAKQVKIPGVMVDYVVVATRPEASWQTDGVYYNPAFSGEIKVPVKRIAEIPLDERKIICRRAAVELSPNAIVNLGVGVCSDVANIANEERVSDLMVLTTEVGNIGGIPATPPHFACAYNAEAQIDIKSQFDYYDGGGLDVAFLGLAQTDKDGNVNVSKFGKRVMGPGGFINISQSSKKVVFCGTLTNDAKIKVEDGKVIIEKEGIIRKFVNCVQQISFSGKYAQKLGKKVLYITERGVFTLEDGQMTLIEIAPGIDLEKDILAIMDFKPRISPFLKEMDRDMFKPVWGKLRQLIEK